MEDCKQPVVPLLYCDSRRFERINFVLHFLFPLKKNFFCKKPSVLAFLALQRSRNKIPVSVDISSGNANHAKNTRKLNTLTTLLFYITGKIFIMFPSAAAQNGKAWLFFRFLPGDGQQWHQTSRALAQVPGFVCSSWLDLWQGIHP